MHVLKRLFLPIPSEIAIYTAATITLLCISNAPTILALVGGDQYILLGPLFEQYFQQSGTLLGPSSWLANAATMLFWASVGAISYMVLWAGINIYAEINNDIAVGTHFVHPASDASGQYLRGELGHRLFQVGIGIVLGYFTLLFVRTIYRMCAEGFRSVLFDWQSLESWMLATAAVVCMVASFHIFAVLMRLLLRRVRVFGQDYIDES